MVTPCFCFSSPLSTFIYSSTMNRSGEKFMLLPLFLITVIVVFPSVSSVVVMAVVAEDDVRCLQGLKNALKDPQGKLDSWTFSDPSVGFICKFTGATCWNAQENQLISLQLPTMNLVGKIPDSLQYCGSIQSLDLSDNAITGTIPSQICDWLPYLVTLDLSSNDLSGPIPPELEKCRFLNNLMLGNNNLSGSIPYELGSIQRLKKFSVANNHLTGQIPSFVSSIFPASSYADNPGLCGKPLDFCRGRKAELLSLDREMVIMGSLVYFVVTVLSSWCWYWLLFAEIKRKTPNNQITRQRASRETRLSFFSPA